MLPFLKPKRVAGVIISHRSPDGKEEVQGEEGDENQGLMACAEDLIRAVHSKDAQGVADAFKAAFEICESYPHDEAPHNESDEGDSE